MDDEIEEGMVVDEDVRSPERRPQQQPPAPPERKAEKSPYEMLRETKSSVEEIVAQILSIKKQGLPKSQLRELATRMFLHFVALRQVLSPRLSVSVYLPRVFALAGPGVAFFFSLFFFALFDAGAALMVATFCSRLILSIEEKVGGAFVLNFGGKCGY